MKTLSTATATLDELTANIKMKLVENKVLANAFNRNINQNSIEIGQMLTQAKKLLQHGQWQFWLAENFDMTDRTARNYMKVAAYFGVNSTLKTENVFRFQPAALIELTKMTPAELQNFLDDHNNNGVDLTKLSVRNLNKTIKQWKNPSPDIQQTTIDIVAEIKNSAPPINVPLKLPAHQFRQIPQILQSAANNDDIQIEINFSRALSLPDSDISLSRFNFSAVQKFSGFATAVIFAAPLEFVRSDGVTKNLKYCICFFGGDSENFATHFEQFGNVILLQTQKKPVQVTGGKYKTNNNFLMIDYIRNDQ